MMTTFIRLTIEPLPTFLILLSLNLRLWTLYGRIWSVVAGRQTLLSS
jgi:hypothetical protein